MKSTTDVYLDTYQVASLSPSTAGEYECGRRNPWESPLPAVRVASTRDRNIWPDNTHTRTTAAADLPLIPGNGQALAVVQTVEASKTSKVYMHEQ